MQIRRQPEGLTITPSNELVAGCRLEERDTVDVCVAPDYRIHPTAKVKD